MGSLTSKPKAPKTQIVYASSSLSSPASSSGTSGGGSTTPTTTTPDPSVTAATRVEDVLRRKRSIAGNVLTSLRGVLESVDSGVAGLARKSLLGE